MNGFEQLWPHLLSVTRDVLRLALWLAILCAVFVPLERWFGQAPSAWRRPQRGQDVVYYFLNNLLPALLLAVPMAWVAVLARQFLPDGWIRTVAELPLWLRLLLGFVVAETGFYWGHRLSHEIPFLWRFHSLHHSAERLDFLVNTRAHPIDMVFGRLMGLLPLVVLGLGGASAQGSVVPVILNLVGMLWSFFIHANLRWRFGALEWLVSTPAFHHWHHTRSGPINRNYASTLPVLDRLFGTHHLPGHWPTDYGIHQPTPPTLAGQLLTPLLRPSPAQTDAAADSAASTAAAARQP